jgi:hypothetical protein
MSPPQALLPLETVRVTPKYEGGNFPQVPQITGTSPPANVVPQQPPGSPLTPFRLDGNPQGVGFRPDPTSGSPKPWGRRPKAALSLKNPQDHLSPPSPRVGNPPNQATDPPTLQRPQGPHPLQTFPRGSRTLGPFLTCRRRVLDAQQREGQSQQYRSRHTAVSTKACPQRPAATAAAV